MPAVEACARCAAPNASFTYTSERRAERGGEGRVVLLLFLVKAQIFEQQHFAGFTPRLLLDVGADAVFRELHLLAEQRAERFGDGCERELRGDAFRPAEMRAEDARAPLSHAY
jgi:hypothetical protein